MQNRRVPARLVHHGSNFCGLLLPNPLMCCGKRMRAERSYPRLSGTSRTISTDDVEARSIADDRRKRAWPGTVQGAAGPHRPPTTTDCGALARRQTTDVEGSLHQLELRPHPAAQSSVRSFRRVASWSWQGEPKRWRGSVYGHSPAHALTGAQRENMVFRAHSEPACTSGPGITPGPCLMPQVLLPFPAH